MEVDSYNSDSSGEAEIGIPKTPGANLGNNAESHSESDQSNKSFNVASDSPSSDEKEVEVKVKSKKNKHKKAKKHRRQVSDSESEEKASESNSESDEEISKSKNKKHKQRSDSDVSSDSEDDRRRKREKSKKKSKKMSSDDDGESEDNEEPSQQMVQDQGRSDSEDSDMNKATKKTSSSNSSDSETETQRKKKTSILDSDEEEGNAPPGSPKKAISASESDGEDGKVRAEELFGDLDVSDDSDASESAPAPQQKKRIHLSDDEDENAEENNNRNQIDDNEEMNHFTIPGSDDEVEDEEIEEEKIEVQIPKINLDLGNQVDFFKLPNFLSIETHPYDPLWYEDEIDEGDFHDEEGRQRLKLKVENTIRWRKFVDERTGEVTRESNARIVKWSDGSSSLHLGDEVFDITTRNMQTVDNHLFVRQGTGLQGQAVFKTKLSFRPYSTDSITHKKLTLSLADRSQKKQKICVIPTVGTDPEAGRLQKIKNEEQALRQSLKNESKQRRIKDRSYHRGPSANYLEGDDDEEENSIAKIKNDYKKGKQNLRYERDSEDSDDSDDEDIFERKKPTEKKKIVESDDEDEDSKSSSSDD